MTIVDDRAVLADVLAAGRAANAAVAASLADMARYYESRSEYPEAAADAQFDHRTVHTSAIAELAAALATTYQTVDELLRQWWSITPLVRDAFADGRIGLAEVRKIREHTLGARSELIFELESEFVRCAVALAPPELGREIDRLLNDADPDWDRESRKRAAATERKVRITPLARGMGRVSTTVTGAESVEMADRIEAELKKVCPRDPRSLDQLRAQAVVELFRKGSLSCECGEPGCVLTLSEPVTDRAAGSPVPDDDAEPGKSPDAKTDVAQRKTSDSPGGDGPGSDGPTSGVGSCDSARPGNAAGPSQGCTGAAAGRRAPTTAYVIHISADLETILGIGNRAAHLHGYGPVDAATARAMAADSTWQITFTASRKYLDLLTGGEDCLDDHSDWDRPDPPPDTDQPAACECTCCDHDCTATEFDDRVAYFLDQAMRRENDTAAEFPDGVTTPTAQQIREDIQRLRELANEQAKKAGTECDLVLGRTRKIPAGFLPSDLTPSSERRRGAGKLIDYWRKVVEKNPSKSHAVYPDGHGGHRTPPPGALTYAPGATLAALVRAEHPVCLHPRCSVPSARCDLDHIVEFDHDDPAAGGWTIRTNLGPFCRLHHNLKTAKAWSTERLPEGVVHLTDPLGNHHFSAPEL
ncbi:DUF222 domain-containing protein [Rhodococcus sp. G-MC3]|uniref:HNH endonuclease signature motif containing protein n=1 Tax=Rhodococcus sp. G-MC3 TaxID=3046209 RepID=UPI0024B93D1F|nr:HNH endonuclease signature motif containing protein [Rhodococcus sp. G-MC3]MDJ0392212.1 DUF222 domain-containing protein [Rhodococcus sp. G-MC3]